MKRSRTSDSEPSPPSYERAAVALSSASSAPALSAPEPSLPPVVATQIERYIKSSLNVPRQPPTSPITAQFGTRVKVFGRGELAKMSGSAAKSKIKKAFSISSWTAVELNVLLYKENGEVDDLYVEVDLKSWSEVVPWVYKIWVKH